MASNKTTTDLIKTVLRRASIPNDQSTFSDEDLIDIMNEEFMANVLPVILRVHEEYYVYQTDISLENSGGRVQIPYRAIGNRLREVHYVDGNNNSYNMTRVALEDLPDYSGDYSYSSPVAFYVENDEIVLVGNTSGVSGSLRLYFFLRPNQIVDNTRAATILGINNDTNTGITTLTLNSMPSDFSANIEFDFIGKRTPNKIKGYDVVSLTTDSVLKSLTFTTSELPSDLVVGDHVLLAEETHIPQIPSELTPILAQRTAIKCLEAMGDTEGMSNASNELQKMEMNAFSLIDNRVEGAPRKVVNRNGQLKTNASHFGIRRRRR